MNLKELDSMGKRVFAMDLFIECNRQLDATLEDMSRSSIWAEQCEGQVIELDPYMGLICYGLDGNKYEVLKEWTRIV